MTQHPQDARTNSIVLKVCGLTVSFPSGRRSRRDVVRSVDLEVAVGECLGLVGESGCGKTTLARAIVGLVEPAGGSIQLLSDDSMDGPTKMSCVQMVFQDSAASLNPRMSVGDSVEEPLVVRGIGNRRTRLRQVESALDSVGLGSEVRHRFPYEMSGGQRQRVGIARALIVRPKLLILDEPVSALDVSVQAQVVNLLSSLRDELGLALLFIAHDLDVVGHIADRIAVMHEGLIVETGATRRLFSEPAHEYTASLLALTRQD